LDTGAPKSIIMTELAIGLVKIKPMYRTDEVVIEIEGNQVTFELQNGNSGDSRAQNINLLGTNFFNNIVLIDDFLSKTIMILKRSPPPERRV